MGVKGALLRELNDRLGADEVFMDVEDIPGGVHFPSLLHDAVCRAYRGIGTAVPVQVGAARAANRPWGCGCADSRLAPLPQGRAGGR